MHTKADFTGIVLMMVVLTTGMSFFFDDRMYVGGVIVAVPTILYLTYLQFWRGRQPK